MSQQPSQHAGDHDWQAASPDTPGRLRRGILLPWKRSVLAGLSPDRLDVPHLPDLDDDGPLVYATARPAAVPDPLRIGSLT